MELGYLQNTIAVIELKNNFSKQNERMMNLECKVTEIYVNLKTNNINVT